MWPALLAAAAAETARRVLAPRAAVLEPVRVDVETYFSAEEIARGRRYARPQLALGLTRSLVDAAALARLVRRPPSALQRAWPSPVAGGAASAAGLSLALSLPTLPLRAISRRRAMAVGLDTQSWEAWAGDVAKASVIQTVFAAAAGAAVLAGTRRFPRSWWAPMGSGAVVFGAGLAALAPVVLDPIFNDFEPLPEGELRSDVLALAREAGVTVGEVFSVDASRRTTAANAYVTGLGPTKRVVLFDTLLDRYSRDEIRLVVAHELAHVRHRDVRRGLAYAAVVAPAAALAVQRLSWELSPERGTPATPARGGAGGDAHHRADRPDRQSPLARDGASRRSLRPTAGRRSRCLRLLRADDRAAECGRHRPAAVGVAAAGHPPADGRTDRRRGGLLPGGVARAGARSQPSAGARMTITQFWPPKPNALAAVVRTSARRAVRGT